MDRVDRTERLLNLVIALMASTQPLSRASIRDRIPGYDGNDVAFERKFERDKDELRSMGIPIHTVVDSGGEVQGYRITGADYALPDLNLSVAERAAIGVAGQAWSEAIAGPVAGRAMLKLNSTRPSGDDHLTPPVQLTSREAALLPLMTAVRSGFDVSFEYQRPAESEPSLREVSPWGLRAAQGSWYLVGFDHQRQSPRTFRLSRVRGPVTVSNNPRLVEPPAGFSLGEHDSTQESVTARIRIDPGAGASLINMATSPPLNGVVEIAFTDAAQLTAAVCAAGPSAVVLEPEDMVHSVIAALDSIIASHEVGL
jgi:proteasome accessory factor B